MFFIQFNDDILIYNLLYNGSYIHKSIKILNFELISSILQISLSNNFLVYSNPMIFSDKICLDLVFNNIRKFYSFLHDQARESIPYRTGRYGRYIPYRSLKLYRNTCVSFQLYRTKHVFRSNYTGLFGLYRTKYHASAKKIIPNQNMTFKSKGKKNFQIQYLSPLSVTY